MSLKLGTQDISGISQNTKYNAHHLLDFKWTDCIMNDVSWLRADTFSWQSGDVYTSAYNHLVADLQGTTAETETIGSYTVTFYRADDGHKICLADQETTVLNIYNETGIAWYYILDTTNTQFKLPRTKYGFEGLRSNVGDKINESLPNINGYTDWWSYGYGTSSSDMGAFYNVAPPSEGNGVTTFSAPGNKFSQLLRFDASRSSSTYQNDAPVQERATQMYLYFYVGDYTQTAIEQTAGLNAELFNGKADINLTNVNNVGTSLGAGWAMPSGTSIAITLGASGTTYIAPANGWFNFRGLATASGQYVYIGDTDYDRVAFQRSTVGAGDWVVYSLPVAKNDTIIISYNTGSNNKLNFIYAVGSESEAS